MHANGREYLNELFRTAVGAAYEVQNQLGAGFLEKVYERSLAHELSIQGLSVETQVRHQVKYKDQVVGEYVADLIVEGKLLIELKCSDNFAPEHLAQCINYLKACIRVHSRL
jgi:GxxExxY protein